MKTSSRVSRSRRARWRQSERGGALIEILIVIGTLAVLAALLVPRITSGRAEAARITCVSHLKELALEARVWSTEHDKSFAWQVSTNDHGSFEMAAGSQVGDLFRPMARRHLSTDILVCPSDRVRSAAVSFESISNENLSYFVALDASEDDSQMILFGDRNIGVGNAIARTRLLVVSPETALVWGNDIHNQAGNICLTDGSVLQVGDAGLQQQLRTQTNTVRFALP